MCFESGILKNMAKSLFPRHSMQFLCSSGSSGWGGGSSSCSSYTPLKSLTAAVSHSSIPSYTTEVPNSTESLWDLRLADIGTLFWNKRRSEC